MPMLTSDPVDVRLTSMDIATLIQVQEKVFQKQLDWIRQADKKSQILMGTNLAMVAGLLSLTSKPGALNAGHAGQVVVGIFFPALSLLSCAAATSPGIKHKREHELLAVGPLRIVWRKRVPPNPQRQGTSLIFFGDIRRLSLEGYSERVSRQAPERYLEDLNSQCHVNATIADIKFEMLRRATVQLAFGFFPWALSIYLLRTMLS